MAEDTVNHAIETCGLENRQCQTENLRLRGYHDTSQEFEELTTYGSDALEIKKLIENDPALGEYISENPKILAAQVVWAVRYEMARCVEDVLARRTRVLFLSAKEPINTAPKVAKIMAKELGKDDSWQKQQIEIFN